MFKLNQPLKDYVEFQGEKINVDMAFDNILDVTDILESNYNNLVKTESCIALLVGNEVADKLTINEKMELFEKIQNELIYQNELESESVDLAGNPLPKAQIEVAKDYCIKHDAEYIYTSFIQAYGIDLHREFGELHWKKFQMLLADLPSDTKFKQVIEIRQWKPDKHTTTKEKESMRELQAQYKLPKDGE